MDDLFELIERVRHTPGVLGSQLVGRDSTEVIVIRAPSSRSSNVNSVVYRKVEPSSLTNTGF